MTEKHLQTIESRFVQTVRPDAAEPISPIWLDADEYDALGAVIKFAKLAASAMDKQRTLLDTAQAAEKAKPDSVAAASYAAAVRDCCYYLKRQEQPHDGL